MVRDYIALFIFGTPIAVLACLLAGQWEIALAAAGIYWVVYRLVKRLVLTVAGLAIMAFYRIRAA